MRNVTADNITDVFMKYFGEDTDPRMREVMQSLAHHLHAFARDVKLPMPNGIPESRSLKLPDRSPTRHDMSSFCCPMFSGCRRLSTCCIPARRHLVKCPRALPHLGLTAAGFRRRHEAPL